jgi:hypothetical protein
MLGKHEEHWAKVVDEIRRCVSGKRRIGNLKGIKPDPIDVACNDWRVDRRNTCTLVVAADVYADKGKGGVVHDSLWAHYILNERL